MKNMRFLVAALLLCALLAACGHQHAWLEASCQTPRTCAECGIIEGAAKDHAWLEASCQAPKTCAECGITEGTAKDHAWLEASCQAPVTCAKCGAKEGTARAHNYDPWGARELSSTGQWIHSRSCTFCGDLQTEQAKSPTIRTDLGSAGSPDGITVIVSIFADESNTGWNFEKQEDQDTRDLMHLHMASATSWLTQQIAAYGAEAQFIYDWETNPDLYYTYDFGQRVLVSEGGSGYWEQESYILDNIPSEALKEKYNAQNIIYMFYFNTDESNTVNSWSMGNNQNLETEIINIFVRDDFSGSFYYVPASSLAHEIMHCFGARDLYYASNAIPQAYVDHCTSTYSMDIMYTTSLGKTIPQLFSQLDAYYMGLVDSCDEVEAWGLGKSAFLE